MNFLFSQEQAAASSEPISLDSGPSDTLNGTDTVNESSPSGSKTASCTKPRSSAMSEHSLVKGTPQAIREWLMCLPQDSLVNRSVSPESEKELTTNETCGQRQQTLFGLSGLDVFCLKMCPEYASTCPWSSETCGDLVTPFADPSSLGLTTLAGNTEESESGSSERFPTPNSYDAIPDYANRKDNNLETGGRHGVNLRHLVKTWPTPTVNMVSGGPNHESPTVKAGRHGLNLKGAVMMWPTPSATDYKGAGKNGALRDRLDYAAEWGATKSKNYPTPTYMDHIERKGMRPSRAATGRTTSYLSETVSGQLNPMWVEWLMGWPLGWTDLKPLEMDKFREWLQQHGRF